MKHKTWKRNGVKKCHRLDFARDIIKAALFFVILLAAPALGRAQIIAQEVFAYSAPGVLSNSTAGGTGFSGTTPGYYTNQLLTVSPTTVGVVAGSLGVPADIFPATGNSIEIVGAEGAWRRLETSLSLSGSATYYFSFLLKVANANTTSLNNHAFLRFHETGQALGNSPYIGIRGTPTGLRLQGFLPGAAIQAGATVLSGGVTYLIIGKIASTGGGNGTLSICAFDPSNPPSGTEPYDWDISIASTNISAIDLIASIGVAGSTDSNFRFDEFRMGSAWNAVVPDPDLVAYEEFAYSAPGFLSSATAGGGGFSTVTPGYYSSQAFTVSPTTVAVETGSIAAPGDIFSTMGNSIEIVGAEGAWRRFATPLPLSGGATYYFSFLVNVANANTTSGNNHTFLRFHETGQSLANAPYVGIRGTSTGLKLQGFLPGGTIQNGAIPLSAGTDYLIVGKIASTGGTNGTLFASAFSSVNVPSAMEPENWDLAISSTNISAIDLMASFGVSGAVDSDFWFDEFRLGTTWRSAVPETLMAEPKTLYVAPTASGNGSGSSALNRAQYASAAFWNSVQIALARGQVTVVFLNGQYTAGNLLLSNMGNPDHRLILQSQTQSGAVFNAGGRMQLNGCQNMTVRSFDFTGNDPDPNVLIYKLEIGRALTPAVTPSKNILIENNTFHDAPTYFGAVGLTYDCHHITFYNNTFDKIGYLSSGHMIYMAWGGHHIKVIGNYFGDTYGNRVRFRHNVDFGEVRLNTFVSTAAVYNLTFIPMYALNNQDPGNELHASNYLIRDNSFTYQNTGGTVNNRNVMGYHSQGFDPPGLQYLPTAANGNLLMNGTPAQKRQVMLNTMNIDLTKVRVFNNTYSGHNFVFRYSALASYGATSKGWEGVANIFNAVNTTPPGPGDLSGDGVLTVADIDLFLLAFEAENEMSFLLDNRVWFADYQAGDFNGDDVVNESDVQPFINLIDGYVPAAALDPLWELIE